MNEIDWSDYDEENQHQSSGCGFLFMLLIILCIPLGVLFVRTIDGLVNDPKRQIQVQLPDFVNIPSYGPKDNSFSMEKIKQTSEDTVWYEVKIQANGYDGNNGQYSFIVKANLKKRKFLSPKIKINEVFKE